MGLQLIVEREKREGVDRGYRILYVSSPPDPLHPAASPVTPLQALVATLSLMALHPKWLQKMHSKCFGGHFTIVELHSAIVKHYGQQPNPA